MPGLLHCLKQVLLAALVAQTALSQKPGPAGPVCGPEIVTVGDAWEAVRRQLRDAEQMIAARDLVHVPQKFAAAAVHLRFMQSGAVMLYGKRRSQMDKGVSAVDFLSTELRARLLQGQVPDYAGLCAELTASARFIAAQFPEEALLPSVSFAHLLPPEKPILHIQLEPLAISAGQPVRVVFQLVQLQDLKPAGQDDILSSHGASLHALICDRTLTDYHHEHPQPTGRPGEWELTFTPAFKDQYRLWINVIPKLTGREEFPVNTISTAAHLIAPLPPVFTPGLTAEKAGLQARITWNSTDKLEARRPISGTLRLTGMAGGPILDLEPYMGAFAHIVGISSDLHGILHAHPMDAGDPSATRSGPELTFTMRPPTPGFYRLFVQVRHRGQIITLPFGVSVP